MLSNAEVYALTAGTILYSMKHSYLYSGMYDGTFYWFFVLDENPDADGEPDTALTKSEVKRLSKL